MTTTAFGRGSLFVSAVAGETPGNRFSFLGLGLAAFLVISSGTLSAQFVPGGIEQVNLTRLVPDTAVYNTGDTPNFDNWEPYSSVLGTNTFLLIMNTFAEGASDSQRFALVFQPANGGSNVLGDAFFDDAGKPYRGVINASRQDGNPGRVAGDTRPGAVNFMTGAEASPNATPGFNTDGRWDLGLERQPDSRFGTVQTFSLDASSLTQTAKSHALDAVNGRLTNGVADNLQSTRFGGDMAALDNGNFVVAVEDRSKLRNPDGNAAVAVVIAPDGSIVKESFVVANGDLWSNVAAFKGGFAVRVAGIIYFFDNTGNSKGQADQADSGLGFEGGRGDDTRIAGHINSPYVYLAGATADGGESAISLAVWDSRDQKLVVAGKVSEFEGSFARAALAVDALDRVTVAFDAKPTDFESSQVGLRVLALDAAGKKLTPLTDSFFPFINHAKTGGVESGIPTVSMTTRQILVAAKGTINLANKPDAVADSFPRTTVYTLLAHPAPKDDPTPAVGDGANALSLTGIAVRGQQATLTWIGGAAPFTLQKRTTVTEAWTDVTTGIATRQTSVVADAQASFFRIVGK